MVLVRPRGMAQTGARYQLICTVTTNDGNVSAIAWRNSAGPVASNSSRLTLGTMTTNGFTSTSVLLFDPLIVAHEDNYTCQAIVREMPFSYTFPVIVGFRKLTCSHVTFPIMHSGLNFRAVDCADNS